MSLKLVCALAFAATSIEAMPQAEPVAIQEATKVDADDVIQYSFVPEITGEFDFEPRKTGATIRGMFGITDYRGAFMYTTIAVALLVIAAKAMGIAIFPNLTEAVSVVAERFDVGMNEVKKGVDIVKKQIRGRGLPLDDETLDSITNVVYDALDAYENFNEIRK